MILNDDGMAVKLEKHGDRHVETENNESSHPADYQHGEALSSCTVAKKNDYRKE